MKDFFDQKSEEFEPGDDLRFEWENIENAISSHSNNWLKVASLFTLFLLVFIPMKLQEAIIPFGNTLYVDDQAIIANENNSEISQKNIINNSNKVYVINNKKKLRLGEIRTKKTNQNHHLTPIAKKSHINHSTNIMPLVTIGYQKLADINSNIQMVMVDDLEAIIAENVEDSIAEDIKNQKLDIYFGSFYNFNRFTPNTSDQYYLTLFEQSQAPFSNRLGFQANFELSGFETFLGKVKPSINYGIINKKFSYLRGSIYYESEDQLEKIHVNSINQFLAIGAKIITRNNYLVGINLQHNVSNYKNSNQVVYNKNIMLLELVKEFKIRNDFKPITIRPFIQYGIPIKGKQYYKTYPINIGMSIKFISIK